MISKRLHSNHGGRPVSRPRVTGDTELKIAVFLPNWIGDAVMATPALRSIRDGFPESVVVSIQRPYVADVLVGTGLVDRMIDWAPRGRDRRASGWRLARRLRSERFDAAVLFPNSLRSAWMAWLSRARRRIGFDRDGRGRLLTDRLPATSRHKPHPVLDDYLRLADCLGCEPLGRRTGLATTEPDERAWDRCREQLKGRPHVCLIPGGAFGAAKHWPTESFGSLARRIVTETPYAVVVVCGPSERDAAKQIVGWADDPRVVSLAEEPSSLGLTKAVVRHAAAMVTTDSGPRHFAPAFGVPVLSLFGPTHIAWSETYVETAVHLQLAVDCGPCQQRTCPEGHHRCMRDLTSEMVFVELRKLLRHAPAA